MIPLDAVTETHFASRPDSQRMIALRTAVNYNLRRDLATQLRVAGRMLPGSAERVRDLVEALRVDRRIKPAVSPATTRSRPDCAKQDVGRVAFALGALSRLLEASPYTEGFQIGPVMWDCTDAEILDPELHAEFETVVGSLPQGLATLRENATLTPLGDRVRTSCRELVDDEMC